MFRIIPLIVFLTTIVSLTAGCGGSSQGSINGLVTVDGQPVSRGVVNFEPVGGNAPTAGAVIQNGSYSVRLKKGRYRVTVAGEPVGYAGKSQEEVMKMPEKELRSLTTNPVPEDAIGNGEVVEVTGDDQAYDIKLRSKGK